MTKVQINSVLGAYALALSLGVFRAASARTVKDMLLVIAFTGAEVSVVHLLERKAKELDEEVAEWRLKEKLRAEYEGGLGSAETEWARRRGDLGRTIEEMEALELSSEEDLLLGDAKGLQLIC